MKTQTNIQAHKVAMNEQLKLLKNICSFTLPYV